MGRLSLVIADNDAEYIKSFEKYLITNYKKRFEILSFSSAEALSGSLKNSEKIDILLLSDQIFSEKMHIKGPEIVLLLYEDEPGQLPAGMEAVKKYQHMDSLVSEMIRLYTVRSMKECSVSGNEATRIISVISPEGGAGKSSIAAGCSVLSAGRGHRAFYLNLEDVPSTEAYFHSDSLHGLTNVIYQLKGSIGNLWMRLEAARSIDNKTGVHFFRSPESILETDELEDQEIVCLINEFRKSGFYKTVFIDLSSGLDKKNSTVLRHSDIIILVLTQRYGMQVKIDGFNKGLELLEHKWRTELSGRIVPVLNFSGEQEACGCVCGYRPVSVIRSYSQYSDGITHEKMVGNVSFISSLNKIIDFIIPDKSLAHTAKEWGEAIG